MTTNDGKPFAGGNAVAADAESASAPPSPLDVDGVSLEMLAARIKHLESEAEAAKLKMNELKDEAQAADLKIIEHEERLKGTEMQLDIIKLPWKRIGIDEGAVEGQGSDAIAYSTFKLPEDIYSTLATERLCSSSFWLSLVIIFGFQFTLLILLLENQINIKSEANPLNLPANVETPVRMGQGLIMIVALFSQDDLLVGIEQLFDGMPTSFRGDDSFKQMRSAQWAMSCCIRITQGALNLFVSFVLCVQSETVFDILLDVMGVAFVSNLDNVAFLLASKGYFGGTFKRSTEKTKNADFRFVKRRGGRTLISRIKKNSHISVTFSVLAIMFLFFALFQAQQDAGDHAPNDVQVEFGDEVVSYLGLFNGCYKAESSSDYGNGRLLYKQVGLENGGKFGFCSKLEGGSGGWTFFFGQIRDPCVGYIVRSGGTRTFDLLEAASDTKWHTREDLPLDYLEINEVGDALKCGQSMLDNTRSSCGRLSLVDGLTTRYFEKLPVESILDSRSTLDPTIAHPIYYHNSSEENVAFDLTLFTGRRWVQTNTGRIVGLDRAGLTSSDLQEFFYMNERFNILEQEGDWILQVSEVVDAFRDQGTPLGLQWYSRRYEKNSLVSFSSADLARPETMMVFSCAVCKTESNPCFYEGVCDEELGACNCTNSGASGPLCEVKPLRDGVCNPYFNTEANNWDGGDCCASSCEGVRCREAVISNPFGLDPSAHPQPFLIQHGHGCQPWQVNGFGECVDPAMATYSVVLDTAMFTFYHSDAPKGPSIPYFDIRCGDKDYMTVPWWVLDVDQTELQLEEFVRLPFGVNCTLSYTGSPCFAYSDFERIELFVGNRSIPVQQASNFSLRNSENDAAENTTDRELHSFSWTVPKSECMFKAVTGANSDASPIPYEVLKFLGDDDFADGLCKVDYEQIMDRFALSMAYYSLYDGMETLDTIPPDIHHCDWDDYISVGMPNTVLSCDASSKVTTLMVELINSTDALFSGIQYLSHLSHLDTLRIHWGTIPYIPPVIYTLSNLDMLVLLSLSLPILPTEIGEMTSLKDFWFLLNDISFLPTEIGNMQALNVLALNENNLESVVTEIGNLQELKWLVLSGNNLSFLPSEIGNLKALDSLFVNSNVLTSQGLPSEIGEMTALTRIDINENALSSPLPFDLGKLTALNTLFLGSNNFSSLPSLGTLTALEFLDLSNLPSLGSLPSLGTLTALEYLDLSNLPGLGSLPTEIGQLTALTALYLGSNNLSSLPSLGALTALEYLDLSNMLNLTSLPSDIGDLTALTHLDVTNTTVSVPAELTNSPNLTIVGLGSD